MIANEVMQGLDITIENPAGSMRHGKTWSQKMAHDYGFIEDTVGADGDEVDVFVGPNIDSDKLYIVEQINKDGDFDEHKVMAGFSNIAEATDAYHANYPQGWDGLKNISELPVADFWDWHKGQKKENCMQAPYKFRHGQGLMERGADRYGTKHNGEECGKCRGGGKYAMENCPDCKGSGRMNAKENAKDWQCQECGNQFNKNVPKSGEMKCPSCGSTDIDVATDKKNAKETDYKGYTIRELPEGVQVLDGLKQVTMKETVEAAKKFIDGVKNAKGIKYRAIKQQGGGYAIAWKDNEGYHSDMMPTYVRTAQDVKEWFDELKEEGDVIEIS